MPLRSFSSIVHVRWKFHTIVRYCAPVTNLVQWYHIGNLKFAMMEVFTQGIQQMLPNRVLYFFFFCFFPIDN